MITECSMSDNVAVEYPDVEFIRPCNLCPHMKRITLPKILRSLQTMEYSVEVDPEVAGRARLAVERMLAVGRREGNERTARRFQRLGVRRVSRSEVLVVGTGVAGLTAALGCAPRRVTVLTKARLGFGGSSPWAQGGIAAAVGKDDAPALHARGHAGRGRRA